MLADEVYDAVIGLLLDGDIPAGARANIESIARDLGVSPTPVREALARLESEGLVVKQALKGYTVAAPLDARGFEDLFHMRLLLEPDAARLAAARIPAEKIAELRTAINDMIAAVDAGPVSNERFADYKAFLVGDSTLHRVIAEATGNGLLSDAIVRLRPHMHQYRLHFDRDGAHQTNLEHTAIVDALEKGDSASADAAMRSHLESAQRRVEEHFRGL
ncbi:MAG: hypothetical protein JWR04_2383 [Rhodoglobus sp.]|jgi:DNA-binding GntR family transcriptional regulator|nr:hypothetical protein [Rhodoglobus sp.]